MTEPHSDDQDKQQAKGAKGFSLDGVHAFCRESIYPGLVLGIEAIAVALILFVGMRFSHDSCAKKNRTPIFRP